MNTRTRTHIDTHAGAAVHCQTVWRAQSPHNVIDGGRKAGLRGIGAARGKLPEALHPLLPLPLCATRVRILSPTICVVCLFVFDTLPQPSLASLAFAHTHTHTRAAHGPLERYRRRRTGAANAVCTVGKEDGGTAVGRGVNRGHNFCRLRSRSTAFPPPDCVCLLPHTHTRTHVRLPPPTNLQRDPQHIYNAHLIFVYKTYRKLPSATRSSIRIESNAEKSRPQSFPSILYQTVHYPHLT